MSNSLLVVDSLVKRFETRRFFRVVDTFTAVNTVSFELAKGEILGLLGPNGAGKTTIIQMLLDLLTPTSGSIQYFGKELSAHRSQILEQVSFASTYLKLPGSLTIEENLSVYAQLYGVPAKRVSERIEEKIVDFDLHALRKRQSKTLSAGQLTRLMLAKAFLANPKVVLLDEPSAALDPDVALQMRRFILRERDTHGTSFIFTSHNMAEVEQVCDRVIVLKAGQIIASQSPKKLASTVTTAQVELLVDSLERAAQFGKEKSIKYAIEGLFITYFVEEAAVPELLQALMQEKIMYSAISLKKPTLEDYFLKISERGVAL
jgi:ABC-2 type transport system ATP-binding protein